MPLTPADVRNVAFSKPPIGKRGYNEDEVDTFLDLVGADLARLIEENTDLRKRVEQLNQQRRAAPSDDSGRNVRPLVPPRPVIASVPPPRVRQTPPDGDHQAQAAKVLGMAQQIADQVTGDARVEAARMLSRARTTCEQLLSDARAKADGMVNEARTRAETTLDDARIRAEVVDRQSREKAASLERDAARKHTEILGSISDEKNILETKVDELRTLEGEYRTRLKIYLESQLRELVGRGSAAPAAADPTRNQQDFVASGVGARAGPGSHRVPDPDPKIGTAVEEGAGAARFSAPNGSPDRGITDEPGTSDIRWKPAVETGGGGVREVTESWASVHRSVS
ncbi:MAG: cell division initiation protein [Pseudonocardiales bacterium]|nr:MAG: cell division initiation protein [Pseudonocardiales bacterium]